MSFWDDIKNAFEDLFDYFNQGVNYLVQGIDFVYNAVHFAVEQTWRFTAEKANQLADAAKDLGIIISQGLIDGSTTAINWLEKNAAVIVPILRPYDKPGDGQPLPAIPDKLISRLIAAVFMRYASEGREFDVFGPLAVGVKEKAEIAIKAGALLAAGHIADDVYNIPKLAPIIVRKEVLRNYISWLIVKAANENAQAMADGKTAQVVTGLVTIALTSLLTEGKMVADAPQWNVTKDMEPDPVDKDAACIWPEGSRIAIGHAIYLVFNGKPRLIPNPETYNNLFDNWDNIIQSEEGYQELFGPLTTGAYLSSAHGDEKVYFVNDGVKQWISSPKIFAKYHFNGRAIRHVSATEQNAIPTGDTIYPVVKRNGAILDLQPQGGLYLYFDNEAHHIPNPATYNQLIKGGDRAVKVSTTSVKVGAAISDGAYLVTPGEKVYFVNNGQKRWIISPLAFESFSFDWNKIRRTSAAELDKIPDGPILF